ncbi:hypothetical protein ACF0H5_006755 [Mactra antiquata]
MLNKNSSKENEPGSYPHSNDGKQHEVPSEYSNEGYVKSNTNFSQNYSLSELHSGMSTFNNRPSSDKIATVKKKFLLFCPKKTNLIIKRMYVVSAFDRQFNGTMTPHSTQERMYEFAAEIPIDLLQCPYQYVCNVENTSFVRNVAAMGGLAHRKYDITSTCYCMNDIEVQRDVWRDEQARYKDVHTFNTVWMFAHFMDIIFHCSMSDSPYDCCIQIEAVAVQALLPIHDATNLVKVLADKLNHYPAISTVLFVVVVGNLFKSSNSLSNVICTNTAKQVIHILSKSHITVNELSSSCKKYMHAVCKGIYKIGFGASASEIQLLDTCFHFYGDNYIFSLIQGGYVLKSFDADEQHLRSLYGMLDQLFDNGSTFSQQTMEYIVRRLPTKTAIDIFSKMYKSNSESNMQVSLYGSMEVQIATYLKSVKKYPYSAFVELHDLLVQFSKQGNVFGHFNRKIEDVIISVIQSCSRDQTFRNNDGFISLVTGYELFSSNEAKQRLLNCLVLTQNLYLLDIFKELCSQWQNLKLDAWLKREMLESFCENYIFAKTRGQTQSCGLEPLIKILCELWDLSFVKQSQKMQHVLDNVTLNALQGQPLKSLFSSIDVVDRTVLSTNHISDAVLSHVGEQLLQKKETPESLLNIMWSAIEGPILQTRLSAKVVSVILDKSGSLPDNVSVVEKFRHLVSKFQFWTLIFSCKGQFEEKVCENLKYQRSKECILEVFDLFKRYEICYDFLKSMDKSQTAYAKSLMNYWIQPNEVERLWLELECKFKTFVEKCNTVKRVINTLKKNEPRFTNEFSHFLSLLKSYLHDLETGNLNAHGCHESLFWRDIEELVESCEELSNHVQSDVFWNTCKDGVFEEVHALYRQEDPLWSIRHLYEKSSFEDIDFKSIFLCQCYVLKLFNIGCSLYHQHWLQLQENINFTMQDIKHMFGARPDVEKEVKFARTILHLRINAAIVNALERIYSIDCIAETVTNIEHLFSVFKIDSIKDIKCQEGLTAFHQLLKGTAQRSTFLEVKQSLETVFELVVKPATDRTIEDIFSTHCSEVYTLTSNHAGQGKSAYIRSVAHRQQMGLVRFHISGQLVKLVLVERLNSLDMKKHHMLHIDIGSVDEPSELDTFLFELIVLKYVSAGRKAVKLVSENVFIELANSIGDTLKKSLHTTVLFRRENISLSGVDRLVASRELNSPIQIVCFYLRHLNEGTLDGTDLMQSSTIYKPLSGKRCKTLLLKFIFKERDESFPVMHTIINVLADQFKKMSQSSFFKVSRLREMVGNKSPISITSKLVMAMIEVATEFATRSVQSCRDTQFTTVNRDTEEQSLAKSDFSTKIANITDGMIRWEDSNHMLFVFHNQNINTLSALYRHLAEVPNDIQNLFESQMKKKMVDFNTLTQIHFRDLLQKIARVNPFPLPKEQLDGISQNYALTADNLLKMVLIMLRIKANIPVLIMGETGCGKTSLIRYLASVCEVKFEVFNIHAGIPEEDIVYNILKNNSMAMNKIEEERWLFLDEINTSDSIGLISDAICHHSCLGCELSPNLVVMGACNPYKLRTSKDISTAGLEGKVKTDELSRLVYRVLPLPEIMVDFVWDFGSLNEKDEEIYIHRMIQDVFPDDTNNHNLFTSLLSLSQVFVRGHEKSQYSVSLRDVQRCRLLAKWFLKVLPKKQNIESSTRIDIKLKSMILSLALSYHARFSCKLVREQYRHTIGELFTTYGMKMDDDQGSFIHNIIKEEQADILRRMKLPTGIARNTALQENVFVILVCIFNRIPIFVVGKPGCSKSLAMQFIRSNLRGKDSEDDFFKTLPQLYCVSFQGSESSTSDGIIKVFKKAESYQDANKSGDVLSVVVLDEIGLAEISRFNPLKVLHSLLEPDGQNQPNVAVVGISNWALDASKMNRAIHLSRPDMDNEELFDTATSISESFLGTENKVNQTSIFGDTHMKSHLPSDKFNKILQDIAAAYFQYIQQLRFKHFHGLRDYYSLVKYVAKEYADGDNELKETKLADIIVHGIARNFGGLPEEIDTLYDVFRVHIASISSHQSQQSPLLELVIENIIDPFARHLMLITTGESVLGILEQKLNDLGSRQREIIFGSQFDEDLTDDYNYRILSRIILCMEQGMILVLKDLDNIYGSLYDMLNQNYTIIGKKKNCRVALGPYSNPICHVADNFRCIVLVDESMLDLSDPPFLNRFEKQYLRFSDIIQDKHSNFIEVLENWIGQLTKKQDKSVKMNSLFPISNKDLLASVVLKIESNGTIGTLEHNIIEECKKYLLQIMKPDAIVRLQSSSVLADSDIERLVAQYFGLPIHDGLEYLMIHQLNHSPDPVLESGILTVVFTNSNIHTKIKCNNPEICLQIEKIGTFKSEKQLSTRIQLFWDDRSKTHLIIQCNAKDEGHHILLTKLVVERCRNDYLLKAKDDKHVYLIIHIDQNNTSYDCLSQLNFLSDWTMFMLDCLDCPRITLPTLCQMSLIDVINERRPLINDLKEELLWAFSRIRYEKRGRSVDSISHALSSIEGSDKLMDMVEMEIIDWLQRQHGARNRYWACEVASNITSLKSSSGFIDALEQYIKDKIKLPFAKLIFQIESMNLLESFFVAGCEEEQSDVIIEKRSKWIYCLRNKCVSSLKDIVDESGPECYTCSSHDCQLRMPCSKTIFDAIEATRNEFMDLLARYKLHCLLEEDEHLPSEVYDEVLQQHELMIVDKIPDLNEFTYTDWSADYLEDFCSLTLDAVLVETFKPKCKPFLLQILDRHDIKFNGDSFGFVLRLHTIVWAHFDSIRAELLLLDHFLSKMPECESDLLTIMSEDEINNGNMKDSDYSDVCSTGPQEIDIDRMFNVDVLIAGQDIILYDEDSFELSEFFDIFSDKIANSSDVLDFSNVSNESGESENAAEVEDTSVSEKLVHFVCKQLLPSNQCINRHKGIANWTLIANETLPLAAQVSREPHALYSLKVCSEIAENFINYFNMNVELLENIGQSLLKHSVDSGSVYDAIIQLIDKIIKEKTLKDGRKLLICYQTLSSYLVRCTSANPDTDIFSNFFKYIVETRINSQYILLFKVPFKTFFRTIGVQMFVNLLSNVNFMDETNFDNSSYELNKTDEHLLQSVDHMIVGLLEKDLLEIPVLALLVDVLVDIFNEQLFSTVLREEDEILSQSKENENEFDEQKQIKMFYECHKSLKNHKPGLNYLASIAFCKCFTNYSSDVMESGNAEQIDKIQNVLNIVHNDLLKNGLHSLTCFLFKSFLQRQTVMQIQKNCFSNSGSLKFNEYEMLDFSSRNLHNSTLCTYVDENVHQKLCISWQDISSSYKENVCELVTSSMKNMSGMIQLFAFIVRDFFLSKIINDHDDSKRTLADLLVNEVIEKGHNSNVIDYVQCLIGRKDFHIRDFGVEQTSSQREICMFSFIVNLIALILANDKYTSCQHKRKSFLTKALLEPESLGKFSVPGFCPLVLTKSIPSTLYTGFCVCRNKVFIHSHAEQTECKVCGNDIVLTKYEYPSALQGVGLDKNMLADDNNFANGCVLQFLVKSCLLGSAAIGYADIDKVHASFNFTWTETTDALLKELIHDWDTIGRVVNINDNDTAILMNALLLAANDLLFSTCKMCLSSEDTNNFELRFATVVNNVFGDKTTEIQKLYSYNNHLHQQDGSQRQFNDQVFEVNDLNTISADDFVIQLPQLYRFTAYASKENFLFEFNRRKHEFPFLMTVLQHQNILSLPKHIMNILSWHSTTVAYASYMMKKQECVQKSVIEFLYYKQDSVKSDIAKRRFENFKDSWETVRNGLKCTDVEQNLPRIHYQTKMENCLILDEQSLIYKVLLTLIHIQNRFLDNVGGIAHASLTLQGMRKKNMIYIPCVPLLELTEDDLLDTKLNLDSILQEETQSDLRYGHGTKVHYDFYRIEEYLAKEFVNGKKYITAFDNLPNIIFIDELHLNYSSLVKEIKGNVRQVPLSADMCNGIMRRRKEGNPRMPSDLLTHLGIVMTIVKEFKANPEQPLVEFVDSWKSLMCRKFPKELLPSPESCIQLCHIVALSELLEELCADYIRDGLSDEYRDRLDPSLRDHLVKLLTDEELSSLLFKALKRFVYRCLASATVDSGQSLRHYISDESFWPNERYLKGSILTTRKTFLILDVFPDGLMVRHVADTIYLIDKENEKRTKGNLKLSGFVSSFQKKTIPAANKRTEQKKKIATNTRKF